MLELQKGRPQFPRLPKAKTVAAVGPNEPLSIAHVERCGAGSAVARSRDSIIRPEHAELLARAAHYEATPEVCCRKVFNEHLAYGYAKGWKLDPFQAREPLRVNYLITKLQSEN